MNIVGGGIRVVELWIGLNQDCSLACSPVGWLLVLGGCRLFLFFNSKQQVIRETPVTPQNQEQLSKAGYFFGDRHRQNLLCS
jgi:hypothetical protein